MNRTMPEPDELIPRHGGYRKLKSVQVAQLVYDVTMRFCDRYLDRRSRTHDQMVQAARSGVQNIAEGSQASGTSRKTELKLTNVARASLEELRPDYEDFLRQRSLTLWPRADARRAELIARRPATADEVAAWAKDMRGGLGGRHGPSGLAAGQTSMASTKSTGSTFPEIAANGVLVLIAVACSLLDRQIASLGKAFLEEGGFTERLYKLRTEKRMVRRPQKSPATGGMVAGLVLLLLLAGPSRAADPPALKFDFGNSKARPGWTQVAASNSYSDRAGYGFEPGATIVAGDGFVAGTNPFYFSVKVPEGNYLVTAALGGSTAESTVTVKAELRRLVLEGVPVAPGKTVTRSFVVNVRTPQIAGDAEVHLKPREKTNEWWAWDEKLTLEFNGTHPALRSLEIEKADVPTIFLLGDSTVCDQPAEPWNSWGQMLPRFFNPEVAVANHAESGETLANSLRAGRFAKVFSLMRRGDYLFMQFGHNDMKSHATNALETYRADLEKVVAETRAKGGTPVLVTSMERKAGVAANTLAGYPDAARAVAREEKCVLIDLNAMSLVLYRALGTNLDLAFQDGTHHNNYGSYELAECVVTGIQQAKLPLAQLITDDFKGFDPAHPDSADHFQMPSSPQHADAKPAGN